MMVNDVINDKKIPLINAKDCPELEATYGFKTNNKVEFKENLFDIKEVQNKAPEKTANAQEKTGKGPEKASKGPEKAGKASSDNKDDMDRKCKSGEISSDHYPIMTTVIVKLSSDNNDNAILVRNTKATQFQMCL